ncbi:MAG TPA: response regulator, partial [Alphaproteobacteria bacterium]
GYEVISAHTYEEATAILDDPNQRIALVVTDLIMPGNKDGIDLIDHIHTTAKGVRPKIIAISGGSKGTVTADTAVQTVKPRVEYVLMKPFKQDVLLGVVRELIGA